MAPDGSDSPTPAAAPINLFHIRMLWFSAFHGDIDVRSLRLLFICKFIPFCLHGFGQYLLVDLLLIGYMRYKIIQALQSIALTLVVSNTLPALILPLLNTTRWILCLLIGIDTKSQYVNDGSDSRRRSPWSRARVALNFIWHSDHECLERCSISLRSRRLH